MVKNCLKSFETCFYFLSFAISAVFAFYRFAIKIIAYFNNEEYFRGLSPGWTFLNREKEASDIEWMAFNFYLSTILCGSAISCLLTEILKQLHANVAIIKFCHIATSTAFILYIFGENVLFFIFVIFTIYMLLNSTGLVIFHWAFSIFLLYSMHFFTDLVDVDEIFIQYKLDHFRFYGISIILSWAILKSLSFSSDNIRRDVTTNYLIDYFAYALYFPTLIFGPYLPYRSYEKGLIAAPNFKLRFVRLCLNLAHSLFWYVLIEIFLHFVYVNRVKYHLNLVKSFNSWELYGYGYTMAHYFHAKYVVSYGVSTAFASFDNVEVPNLPRCVSRIHLYSKMWKYFDVGLYQFLLQYIYFPTLNQTSSKLFSSFICFTFIYIWHGFYYCVLTWTLINFFGILMEYLISRIYKQCFNNNLKISAYRLGHLECFLAAPLLGLSAISNFYFFSDINVGWHFFKHIYNAPLLSNLILFFVLFCICQVSSRCKNWPAYRN